MPSRDSRLLIFAGIIGLAFGGLAGLAGGFLVSTGKIGSLGRYLTLPTATINAPLPATTGPAAGGTAAPGVRESGGAGSGFAGEESATIDVVRRSSPAVVSIVVRKEVARGNVFPFDDFFEFGIPIPRPRLLPTPEGEPGGAGSGSAGKQQVGGGSGFIVTSDGYILTNRHVVTDSSADYAVVLSDDRELPAKVLAKDPLNDLAVLKIDAGNGALPVLELGDSDQIRIGETVIAIGYALSEFRNTVTKGVISGVNRRVVAGDQRGSSEVIQEAIQTDAAINPGNSGGPLLNLRGQVIGVNTAVSREGQLIGFAIPINVAKHAVESVIRDGKIVRPWLGVRYLVITERLSRQQQLPIDHGALIVRGSTPADLAVVPGSPADKGGVRENDIITEVDGERINEDYPLANRIARKKPGDRVRLTILRQGKEKKIEVVLGEFPE